MSQPSTVLTHLQRGHALTSLTAFRLWHMTRLADAILKLRKRGYDISTTMEGNGSVRWAVYRLNAAQHEARDRQLRTLQDQGVTTPVCPAAAAPLAVQDKEEYASQCA